MLKRTTRLKKEAVVLFAGLAFLFASAVWYAFSVPDVREWGPVLVRAGSPERRDIDDAARISRALPQWYNVGRRPNPFLPIEKRRVFVGGASLHVRDIRQFELLGKEHRTVRDDVNRRDPVEPEKPVRVKGTWRTKGSERFAILQSRKTGDNFNVREGDEIPQLGLKTIRIGHSTVVVEDEDGKRLTHDLIRPSEEKE